MRFYNSFPEAVQVGGAQSPVIEAVAGHRHFIPNHPAVVGADGAFKTDIIEGQHNFIHVKSAVGGKMGGFFEIRGTVEFQVPHMGKMNPAFEGADHVGQA